MLAGLLHLAKTTPPLSTPVFATFWFVVVFSVVLLSGVLWLKLRDRTYFYYGAYVGMIGVMSLVSHVLGNRLHDRMGDDFIFLNNLLHVPYAVFYLFFVGNYFSIRETGGGWRWFHRGLLAAYGAAVAWLLVDAVTSGSGSEWAVLGCNLVNLLSSLVLAGVAAHDNRPGAREFLYASLPLTVSGLVLVAQFLAGSAHDGGAALLAFRTGFIMHVMIFLIALSVRYRELRNRLG